MYSNKLRAEANAKYSSQYRGELANHLPMALVALEKMGATPERLRAYRDNYVKRLEPLQANSHLEINQHNWKDFLGQNRYHSEYINYFKARLEGSDIDRVLNVHLPFLFRGVAGGAFHGLIRLGYALETHNVEEIYQSLGYWAISFLDLSAQEYGPMTNEKNPAEIFSTLSAEFVGFRPVAPNIARRMELIGRLDNFRRICRQVNLESVSYKTIAPVALALFAQTQDFTALHAVTASHAYRIVSEHFVDDGSSAYFLFVALAAAYVSIRAPAVRSVERNHMTVSWGNLIDAAVNSNDDHIPKIVYTCLEEFKEHKDPAYYEAAFRYASS